jgi:hypothetical protein
MSALTDLWELRCQLGSELCASKCDLVEIIGGKLDILRALLPDCKSCGCFNARNNGLT